MRGSEWTALYCGQLVIPESEHNQKLTAETQRRRGSIGCFLCTRSVGSDGAKPHGVLASLRLGGDVVFRFPRYVRIIGTVHVTEIRYYSQDVFKH